MNYEFFERIDMAEVSRNINIKGLARSESKENRERKNVKHGYGEYADRVLELKNKNPSKELKRASKNGFKSI